MGIGESTTWEREQRILNQLLETSETERVRVLKELHQREPELGRTVELLLSAWLSSESFLESPAPLELSAPNGESSVLGIGQVLGAYEVVALLGHGGMGSVYLGRRSDGSFDRHVAIKVLRAGLNSDDMIRRFQVEGQILAALDHPNIASLYDGGTTPAGQPYFVMECVEGLPIDQYVSQHRLSIKQRVLLFQKVCRAVDHAHRNLVIHRDIKPSNILVTSAGEPKLLDFGIAKLLSPDPQSRSAELTQTGFRPMTPRYASPEQKRGDPITTSSDVYSLGVLLFKLLTGKTPDTGQDSSVSGTWTTKPSAFVLARAKTNPQVSQDEYANEPRAWSRMIKGDLDRIAMMALREDVGRRYGSVNALSEDLERFMSGHPVKARHETIAYVFSKFVRRNRLAVVGLFAFFALLITFIVTTTIQNRRIATERDRARIERDKAHTTARFMIGLFEKAVPNQANSGDMTVRELLDQGAQRLETEMSDQKEIQSALQHTIGRVLFQTGDYEESGAILEKSLATRRELGSVVDPYDVSNTLEMLAITHQFRGQYTPAKEYYLECLEIRERVLPPTHKDIASITMNLGTLYHFQGDYEQAQPYLERALALIIESLGPEHSNTADCMDALGGNLRFLGRRREAAEIYQRALEIRKRAHGDRHLTVAFSYNHVAVASDDPILAESHYEKALAIYQDTIGMEHPYASNTLSNYAELKRTTGAFDEALKMRQQAFDIRLKSFGNEHEYTADVLYQWGIDLRYSGKHEESIAKLERSMEIHRHNGNTNKAFAAEFELAKSIAHAGDMNRSKLIFHDLLQRDGLPVTDVNRVRVHLELAELELQQHQLSQCAQFLEKVEAPLEHLDPKNKEVVRFWHFLKGQLAMAQQQPDIAEEHFDLVLQSIEADLQPWSVLLQSYALIIHHQRGDHELARPLVQRLVRTGLQDPQLDDVYLYYDKEKGRDGSTKSN